MIFKRVSFFTCVYFLLLPTIVFGRDEDKLFSNYKEVDIKSICEIPEDVSAFKAMINSKVGEEISGSDIELLKNELAIVRDEEVIDLFYSRTEKVRFVGLTKLCIAADKVPYKFVIWALMDLSGNAILSQTHLIYEVDSILNGKRKFSFKNVFGRTEDYTKIISKNAVGLMNKAQFEKYMLSLGCTRIAVENEAANSAKYLYKVEPEKDLLSRLAVYNFSQRVNVDFDHNGMVSEIFIN